MQFIQAKHFRQGGNLPITRIVLHDMEMPEKPDTAEACARYFQTIDRPASAHYCVDNDSIVQCVLDTDTAYHAPPNQHSIGVEHAGYARQATGEWLDDYGVSMLRDVSAPLVRGLCEKYDVPKVWLTVDDLLAGKRGITSHNNVSLAFHQSTHTDPGPNFPITQYMQWVTQSQGDDMPLDPNDKQFITDTVFNITGGWTREIIKAIEEIKNGGATADQILDELKKRLEKGSGQ